MLHSWWFQGIEGQKLLQVADRWPKSGSYERDWNEICNYTPVNLLTFDENSWGFVKTTIPPNNVINRITKIMSFKKSICGSKIDTGSKICWILSPKSFLKSEGIFKQLRLLRFCPLLCILWNSFLDFGKNSFDGQCFSTLLLWCNVLKKMKNGPKPIYI